MATNKNQHFVPRCHLRPFTVDGQGAAINVFNIDRNKLILGAPVKNQCSRDYFYGKDEKLEYAIQSLESGYGNALAKLTENSKILSELEKTVFRTFWIFQNMRTEAAARQAAKLAESLRTLADLPRQKFSLGIKEAVQIACRAFVDSMHDLDDIKCCIIKNRSKIPFITSDNPAILTNRWRLERRRDPVHSFGMGSAGLVVILPLTPKLLFLGYDGDVYGVANESGIVNISSERDVRAFNQHQFLQCAANIYLHSENYESEIRRQFEVAQARRPQIRHVVHYAQLDSTHGDHLRYLVIPPEEADKTKEAIMHSQVIHPNPSCWPSQIKYRSNGTVYTNGTGIGYIRFSGTMNASTKPFWKERP
jgi:Protein of unknown function (DUF4238)